MSVESRRSRRHSTLRSCQVAASRSDPPTYPARRRQARAAIAAAPLPQLFVVVTRRVAGDPAIAGGTAQEVVAPTAT